MSDEEKKQDRPDGGETEKAPTLREKLLEKYRQLPAREKAFVKYGGAVVAVIILWFAVIDPMAADYRDTKEAIPQVKDRISRYKAVVEATDENKKVKEEYQQRFEKMLERCLEGKTSEIAAGNLTEIATAQADKQNLQVKSTKTEKPRRMKNFEQIQISITFNATLSELATFMQGLASHQKEITIPEAKVSSYRRPENEPELLSVELLVAGLRHIP